MKKCLLALFLLFLNLNGYCQDQKSLYYPSVLNIRQGLNQCGPCSIMASIYIKRGVTVNVNTIDQEIPNRKPYSFTYPESLISELKKYKVASKLIAHTGKSTKEKLLWIEGQIKLGNPVIILIKTKSGILHWITILGYSASELMFYDSYQDKEVTGNLTIDSNGNSPGNRNMNKEDFIKLWTSVEVEKNNSIAIEIL